MAMESAHSEEDLICPRCPTSKIFKSMVGLILHGRHKHGDSQTTTSKSKKTLEYRCEQCPSKLTGLQSLRDHMNFKHRHLKNYDCPVPECGQKFGWKSSIRNHISKVHKKSIEDKCSNSGIKVEQPDKHCSSKEDLVGKQNEMEKHIKTEPFTRAEKMNLKSDGRANVGWAANVVRKATDPVKSKEMANIGKTDVRTSDKKVFKNKMEVAKRTNDNVSSGMPYSRKSKDASGENIYKGHIMDNEKAKPIKRKQEEAVPNKPKKTKNKSEQHIHGHVEPVVVRDQHRSSNSSSDRIATSKRTSGDVEETVAESDEEVIFLESYPSKINEYIATNIKGNVKDMPKRPGSAQHIDVSQTGSINAESTVRHQDTLKLVKTAQNQPQPGITKHEPTDGTTNAEEDIKSFKIDAEIFQMSANELNKEVDFWRHERKVLEQREVTMKKELAYFAVLKDQIGVTLDTIKLQKKTGRGLHSESELDDAELAELATLSSLDHNEDRTSTDLAFIALEKRRVDVYLRKLDIALN